MKTNQKFEVLKKAIKECGLSRSALLALAKNFRPVSCLPYVEASSYRMSESWRSVCIPLENGYNLVIKGSEFRSPDLHVAYQKSFRKFFEIGSANNAGHFFEREKKTPLLLTSEEARSEFEISLKISEDYFKFYHEIPLLPIPIGWFEFSADSIREPSFRKMRSEFEKDFGTSLERSKLGVLAYLYKGHPARIKTWKQLCESPKISRKDWLAEQREQFDVSTLLTSFAKLFTRLSNLGWILTPVGQDHLGFCLKAQNLTFAGGFVDLGNAYRVGRKLTERDRNSFLLSISVLTESISQLLHQKGRLRPDLSLIVASRLLVTEIERAWEEDLKIPETKIEIKTLFHRAFSGDIETLSSLMNEMMDDDLNERLDVIF